MDRWSQLSLKDKSDLMSLYIQNGISSLEEIKKHYNSYDNGGNINKDITEVLNDVPCWKQGLATEQHIPHVLATREQYIQNQRDAVRQIAYQNSLERTEPEHYKVFRKIKDEEIPLYKEIISYAEATLNNPTVADKEKQQAKSDITTLKDILRRGSVYEDEENCIYTALTNYGKQYRVPGNQSFRSNPAKYGFKEINLDDVKQGDIIQYLGRGVPKHGAIYSKSEDGKILANYSNGTTEYRKNAYYGYNPKYAYRFIGLPEDLSRWNQEYNNLINSFATGGHLYQTGGPDNPPSWYKPLTVAGTTSETSDNTRYVRPISDVEIDIANGLPEGTTTMRRIIAAQADRQQPVIKQDAATSETHKSRNKEVKKAQVAKKVNDVSNAVAAVTSIPATIVAPEVMTPIFALQGFNDATDVLSKDGSLNKEDYGRLGLDALFMLPMFNTASNYLRFNTNLGRSYELSRALNKSIRNIELPQRTIKNSTNSRFRLGDVEINDPNLMYHVDNGDFTGFSGNGAYVKDGLLFPTQNESGQTPYTWWNLGKPYRNNQSRLLTVVKDNPNLLKVRDQNYPIGQWTGNPTEKSFVTNSEYVSSKPIKIGSQYEYIPNYGYRRVQEPTPTLDQAMQEARNAKIEVPEVLSAREPFEMSNIPNWREIFSNYNPNTTRTVRTTVSDRDFKPSLFDLVKVDTDKRFEFFEPGKFLNYDLSKMSVDEVVKTFGPDAKHLKNLYDLAAAHNFEGKYADLAKDIESKISKMFAINPEDIDIAAGIARARSIYDIPEYTERFKKYGDLGETFIQDAKSRLDNIQLQGLSRDSKITGQHGTEGGASTSPHPTHPTIRILNYDKSSTIREFMTHEANHAAHGTHYQPKWMEIHNEKIRPVPKKNRKDFTNFDKYLDEMDELVERSKTAVEYADETRLEGETLDQALDRVFEAANKDVYNSEIPSDIRQMVKNYEKESTLNFWKNFLGGLSVPIGVGIGTSQSQSN